MTDEKFVFVQDLRSKKAVARGARNRRTHAGKGGAVKFPSDYLTPKELKKMSGEVKSYRINEPMTWAEFKAMPDDIKVSYVKLLRERFDVPDSKIGEMMGANKDKVSLLFNKLGLRSSVRRTRHKWDEAAWLAWCNGIQIQASAKNSGDDEEPVEKAVASLEDICEPTPVVFKTLPVRNQTEKAIPCSGSLTFTGSASDALNVAANLLGGGKCPCDHHLGTAPCLWGV